MCSSPRSAATHGKLVGFAKVTRDLTERRAAQERELAAVRQLAEQETERRAMEVRAAELRSLNHELEERARKSGRCGISRKPSPALYVCRS